MSKELVFNEAIRSPIVKLILSNGENKGEFSKAAAIQLAKQEGLDLVQVVSGNPPICKIADYGKIRFKQSKAEHKQKAPCVKEIRFGIDIAQHDLDVKTRKIKELIEKGHKVIVSAKLNGRQKYTQVHKDAAKIKLNGVIMALDPLVHASDIKDGDDKIFVTLSRA